MDQDSTADEVAVFCRVHVATVRRWIVAGKIKAVRLPGGRYRIPPSEVERLREPMSVEKQVARASRK